MSKSKDIFNLKSGWDVYIPEIKTSNKHGLIGTINNLVGSQIQQLSAGVDDPSFVPTEKATCGNNIYTSIIKNLGIQRGIDPIGFQTNLAAFKYKLPNLKELGSSQNFSYFRDNTAAFEFVEDLVEAAMQIFEEQYEKLKGEYHELPYFQNNEKLKVKFLEAKDSINFFIIKPDVIAIDAEQWKDTSLIRKRMIALHEIFHYVQLSLKEELFEAKWFLEGLASLQEVNFYNAVLDKDRITPFYGQKNHIVASTTYEAMPFWLFFEKFFSNQTTNPLLKLCKLLANDNEIDTAIDSMLEEHFPTIEFFMFYQKFGQFLVFEDWMNSIDVYDDSAIEETEKHISAVEFFINKNNQYKVHEVEVEAGAIKYILVDVENCKNGNFGFTVQIEAESDYSITMIKCNEINHPIDNLATLVSHPRTIENFTYSDTQVNYKKLLFIITNQADCMYRVTTTRNLIN